MPELVQIGCRVPPQCSPAPLCSRRHPQNAVTTVSVDPKSARRLSSENPLYKNWPPRELVKPGSSVLSQKRGTKERIVFSLVVVAIKR